MTDLIQFYVSGAETTAHGPPSGLWNGCCLLYYILDKNGKKQAIDRLVFAGCFAVGSLTDYAVCIYH